MPNLLVRVVRCPHRILFRLFKNKLSHLIFNALFFSCFGRFATKSLYTENPHAVREQTVPRVCQFHQPVERQYFRCHRPRPACRLVHRVDAPIAAHHRIAVRQSLLIGRADAQFDPVSAAGERRHANGQVLCSPGRPSARSVVVGIVEFRLAAERVALGLLRSVHFQLQEAVARHCPIGAEDPQRAVPEAARSGQSHRRTRTARTRRHLRRESDEFARCLAGTMRIPYYHYIAISNFL